MTPVQAELVASPRPASVTVAGFTVLHELGRGGTGTVYLARQEPLDRLVALKILDPQLAVDDTFTARFYREARSAALFQHPNVVAVHAAGHDPHSGAHWIAFEYMRDGSLEELLAREGCLSERRSLELVLGISRALVFAETRGLVHRDVKPGNVLMAPDGTPKLADLGLAKQADPELAPITQQGMIIGTPYYMAPEQALGSPDLDGRADIYALGLCLWRMVTGRIPFLELGEGGAGLVKVLARRLNQSLPDVRQVAPELGAGVATILLGMTARRRRDRYASAREVVADVERALRGEPAVGPQPTAALQRSTASPGDDPLASTVAEEEPTPPQQRRPAPVDPLADTRRPADGAARPEAISPEAPTVAIPPPPLPEPDPASLIAPTPILPAPPAPPAPAEAALPLPLLVGLLLGLGAGVWLLTSTRGSGSTPAAQPGGPIAAVTAPPSPVAGSPTAPGSLQAALPRPAPPEVPGEQAAPPDPEPDDEHPAGEVLPGSEPWSATWIDETGFLVATDLARAAERARTLGDQAQAPASPARRRFAEALRATVEALQPGIPWSRRRPLLERLLHTLEPRKGESDAAVELALGRWAALVRGGRELRLALGDPRRAKPCLELLGDLPGSWATTAQARRVLELVELLDAPATPGPLGGPDPTLAIPELRRGALGRIVEEELGALEGALARLANDPQRSRVAALGGAELAPYAATELLHGRVVTVPAGAGWSNLPGRGLDLELSRTPAAGQSLELDADGCTLRLGAEGIEVASGAGEPVTAPLDWRGGRQVLLEALPGGLLLRIPGARPEQMTFPRNASGPARFSVRLRELSARRLLVFKRP